MLATDLQEVLIKTMLDAQLFMQPQLVPHREQVSDMKNNHSNGS
jgi:hypothetical protein